MDPYSFHAWANALRRLPDASLWLSRVSVRKDSSPHAEASLRAEAAAHGVSGRLGFAWKMPGEVRWPRGNPSRGSTRVQWQVNPCRNTATSGYGSGFGLIPNP